MKNENIYSREIDRYNRLQDDWWNPQGAMKSLHVINPLRIQFITDHIDLKGVSLLDVGCGGGILSEELSRRGARVLGIDPSSASIQAARRHARQENLSVTYQQKTLEDLVLEKKGNYDVITCMEVLEHVPDPRSLLASAASVLREGGLLFCATINRIPKSFLMVIVGGEWLLRLLPRGSHDYRRFIRPVELKNWAAGSSFRFVKSASLMYNPFTRKFRIASSKEDMNYMCSFRKVSH